MATGASPPAVDRPLPIRPQGVARQPRRVGYDCEFFERPPKAVQSECPVCLLVLREPHQVTCCGYSFCAACVKRVQEDIKCCPTCKKADFTVFPDKRLKRSLNEYRVYCCQRRKGCEWVGELGELDRHLNLQPPPEKLLVGCQFSEVDCTYCVQPFQRRYVQAHQSDDCPKRPYACEHCNKFTATFEEVTRNHWPVCSFFPLSCPNKCDVQLVLQRQEVEHHVSQDCPLTLVQCDFHMAGCQVELPRRDMLSHISENLAGHMLLQQKMLISQQAKLTRYEEEIQQLREALSVSEQKLQTQQTTIEEQRRILEMVTCTGTLPFEFSMTDFVQHKAASDRWYSPPFYTHTRGYKMCIRVDANGWDYYKGKYLSVFGVLMQGDFDDDLQWPFQGAITIQLLNQLEDSNHHTQILNFTYSEDYVGLQRVTSGERAQRSCAGIDPFLSHSRLGFRDYYRNCQFLKDNQLKFRVSEATNLDPTARIHRRCLALESFAGAIEPQVCVPPIEFTLSDFEQQKKQNSKWYSPAFYTHSRGYQMCLLVYPNGSRDGLGTYVSIFTHIIRGPFDSVLKWPFRGDVTIQVVNQAGEDNHWEMINDYSSDTPDDSAGRVTAKERSLSWGFDQFLPHSSLGYDAAMNTQYLREDSLRIRISKVVLKK